MTRCFVYLLLMSVISAWNIVPTLGEEQARPNRSSGPATSSTPATAEKPKEEPTQAKDAAQAEEKKTSEDAGKSATPADASQSKPASASPANAAKTPESSAGKAATPANPPAPATYTVKKSPLKITVDLDGVFESRNMREIIIKPEEWLSFKVVEAAAHGQQVKEGDVLLKLDTEKIDQAISDMQTDQNLSEIALHQMEDQLQAAEKLAPIELDFSQRRAKNSEEDLANYLEIDRPFYLKMADFGLQEANNKLEYDEEELRQLEKMYKADDVSEETEKIVMKRAQDTVNRSKFFVEYQGLSRDQTLKYSIPRMDNQIKETAQRWAIDWEKNKVELPLLLQKQRFELEKLKVQRERLAEKLKKLQADRNLMTVKSPIDGVVYYGKSVRGRFSDSTNIAENLRPNNVIQPNQTIMTVVQPHDMFIHAAVPENQLHYMHRGLKGKATPTAYPDVRLGVVVKQLGDVPFSAGSFDVRLSLTGDEPEVTLEPGMTCKVKLTAYLKKEALTVPPKVLTPDELDDQKFYVYVLKKNGKTKKVCVTVGEKTDKKAEILKGLHEGDQVLLEAPKN